MNENERLQELLDYKILDTSPEKDLDELVEITSALCGTPISLLTFVDDKRQWFKASKGMSSRETAREHSFCQHALHTPEEVLVIDDPVNDERFRGNLLVFGESRVRFYAGAPLATRQGNVLGTLCIMDNKPREISDPQKRALQLLAKKAMDYLTTRKLLLEQGEKIHLSAERLKKLTDQAPGCIYQFEVNAEKKISFSFVSKGVNILHPSLSPERVMKNPELPFEIIHPEDVNAVRNCIKKSLENHSDINIQFRVPLNDQITWLWASARPERKSDGTLTWYGIFQDITNQKEYIQALEGITFDISHVLRRPVATMLGLASLIERDVLNEKEIRQYAGHIKTVSQEMDDFTRRLNNFYSEKRSKFDKMLKCGS